MMGHSPWSKEEWKTRWPNFKADDFICSCCGAHGIKEQTLDMIQGVRTAIGKPVTVTSGYRCPRHPVESKKAVPGEHTTGLAVDVACHSDFAMDIAAAAIALGVRRVGVSQKKGLPRFLHLGMAADSRFPKALYSY